MAYTKRRVVQHIMEDRSMRIVRARLPEHWVIRDYRPDYGIDLLIELFEYVDEGKTEAATLGETLFVQVKSTEVVRVGRLRVYRRMNVALGSLQEDRSGGQDIDVVRLQLATSELLTVQSIGSAVPVLLFYVELSTGRIYYVCLNDLIDKVILPHDPEFDQKATKVIHIPARNCIVPGNMLSIRPLETYAKRAKLYAAFQKFAYQEHQIGYAHSAIVNAACDDGIERAGRDLMDLVRHFASENLRFDFWTRMPEWKPIALSHRQLIGIQEHARNPTAPPPADLGWRYCEEIVQTWARLANLSRLYEEIGREWFLPTDLATRLGDDLRDR